MNTEIDKANREFWNELCGSAFAKYLGITDHSAKSLERFDKGYLDFYPYLLKHVKLEGMAGKKVLEIGLGYGTLGQKIAEAGADYIGLDIAEGPVKMMNARMEMQNRPGKALQGSMLDCPLASESLDYVVSIGCFHHTGNVQRCIDETHRILKPGGTAMIMVYNQFSYVQWKKWPLKTFEALMYDLQVLKQKPAVTDSQRGLYDSNLEGNSAPETDFLSIRRLGHIFKRYSAVSFHKENCNSIVIKGKELFSRETLLPTLGNWMGLDIYVVAQK